MKQTLTLKNGTVIPRLGQGTWFMGEDQQKGENEITSLRQGIRKGMNLIDTAEMYGEGLSESLVGRALQEADRKDIYLVSKVYPHNAGRNRIFQSVERSLERLNTDYLDLYLLHWRGSVPLKETVACMEELVAEGRIKSWGVSNFDTSDMEELFRIPKGENCVVNQVLYHLGSRGVEYDLLPWLKDHQTALMAYCPLAQAGRLRRGLLNNQAVLELAHKYEATPAQILLAFVLLDDNVFAIPKAGTPKHVEENAKAYDIRLTSGDLEKLNQACPAPARKVYLDMV